MSLVNRRGLGKAKHIDMQSTKFVTKNVGTNVNFPDLKERPLPRPNTVQLVKIKGCEFLEQHQEREELLHETGELTATCRMKFDRGVLAMTRASDNDNDNDNDNDTLREGQPTSVTTWPCRRE